MEIVKFFLEIDVPEVLNLRRGHLLFEEVKGLEFWFSCPYYAHEKTEDNGRCVKLSESPVEGYAIQTTAKYGNRIYLVNRERIAQISVAYLNAKTKTALELPIDFKILEFKAHGDTEIAMHYIADLWDPSESVTFTPLCVGAKIPETHTYVGSVAGAPLFMFQS